MAITHVKRHSANLRMASDLLQDGFYGFVPWDLTQFGSVGASIAAARGRYVWIVSADHPNSGDGSPRMPLTGSWMGGDSFLIGYSNDIGCPPESWAIMLPSQYLSADARDVAAQYTYYHFNDFFYNPDDATYPFYMAAEGYIVGASPGYTIPSSHEGGMLRSADLITWHGLGGTHLTANVAGVATAFTSFHRVRRLGAGSWMSIGCKENTGAQSYWTATSATGTWVSNGVTVSRDLTSPARHFIDPMGGPLKLNIDGQDYMLLKEQISGGDAHASLVPVNSTYDVLSSPASIRLTQGGEYDGVFPSFGHIQMPHWQIEDGVIHLWVTHGFPADSANPKQGQREQSVAYYTAIHDATAAANAAPVGVRIECHMGAVVVSWYDALPHQNYRVYKSTDGGSTYPTSVDVSGLGYVDAAGAANATYYYKVVTRSGGIDRGQRIVKTYVSVAQRLTNEHVTRATAAGATNINVAYVDRIVTLLRDMDLTDNCLYWTDPRFGVIKDGSNVISTVYCLGSTIHRAGGDWRSKTGSTATTYGATGFAASVPAVQGTTAGAHGYFGDTRYNTIRRKVKATFGVVYKKSHTNAVTFYATSEYEGIRLFHEDTGTLKFGMERFGAYSHAASIAVSHTGTHVIIASFDGLTQSVYSDGVAGTPVTGVPDTYLLDGYRAGTSSDSYFLGTGTANLRLQQNTGAIPGVPGRAYSDLQAQYDWATKFVFDTDLSPTQVKILNTFLTTDVAGAVYTLPSYSTPFVKDIKADYTAPGNGTSDDGVAFGAFRTAALAWQASNTGLLVLKMPAGIYLVKTNVGIFAGLINLLVLGADKGTVSFIDSSNPDWGPFLGNGSPGHVDWGGSKARINTVTAGSNMIQCTTAADRTMFTVGKKLFLAGLDIMGWGEPPNFGYFEWPTVQSIAADGTLTLSNPIEYGYKSTWPVMQPGFSYGPAEAWPVQDGWDGEHEYRHLTIAVQANQTKSPKRFVKFNNCVNNGPGFFPTENEVFEYRDITFPDSSVEVDKIVGSFRIVGGYFHGMTFQSPTRKFVAGRGTIFNAYLNGGGAKTNIDGIYMKNGGRFAPTAFGAADEVIVQNSTINGVQLGGIAADDILAKGFTMSGGVITVNKAAYYALIGEAIQWANPGRKNFWTGSGRAAAGSFRVLDISESGGNLVITTDQSGGFPALTSLGIRTHPGERFIMRGVSSPVPDWDGNYEEVDSWSKTQPFKPMYAQAHMRYHGSSWWGSEEHNSNLNSAEIFQVFGALGTIVIDVYSPYIGEHVPLLWQPFSEFGGHYVKTDGTSTMWNPVVDLRVAGVRTITASGVTGAVGLDDLTPPANPIWICDQMQPFASADVTDGGDVWSALNGPGVNITFQLDQSTFTFGEAASRVFLCSFA